MPPIVVSIIIMNQRSHLVGVPPQDPRAHARVDHLEHGPIDAGLVRPAGQIKQLQRLDR